MPPGVARRDRYRDRDLAHRELLPHEQALVQDLELDTLLHAMAGADEFVFGVAREVLLAGAHTDLETVLYRQDILQDCLAHPDVTRRLYALAGEAIECSRKGYFGVLSRFPSRILYEAVALMQALVEMLRKLRSLGDANASSFRSQGFTVLFETLQNELGDEYLAEVQRHLEELRFPHGVLLSAELGEGNKGTNYVLRQAHRTKRTWWQRLFGRRRPAGLTFFIADRDDAGMRALGELRDRGIDPVANALAQSTEYVLGFFTMLQTELAFYVGCLNLFDRLTALGVPLCFPRPEAVGTRRFQFAELCDACLALSMGRTPVGNTLDASGKHLVVITGANQGGKSSFLRAVGLAQVMMQAGMFVAARSFAGELCNGLYTHYLREEDATMKRGKLDEELARMSRIADALTPGSVVLCNESFASTNEREGSEIAAQVFSALLERGIKVFFVTHLYELARVLRQRAGEGILFLRAERLADGSRTFKMIEGEPLPTSYGQDVYRAVFGEERNGSVPDPAA
jgi:DNA mismatch repair ATPase MutS